MSEPERNTVPRVIVVQHGFRHRYMVARMLQESGCLERLYTDTTAYSLLGKFLGILLGKRRLRDREPQDIPRTKVFAGDFATLARFVPGCVQRRSGLHSQYDLQHRLLSWRMKRWGFGNANWIYTMFDESLPFVRHARRHSIRVAVDVFINPTAHRIILAEAKRMGLASPPDLPWDVEKYERDLHEIFELADLLLCPSDWVADGVRAFSPQSAGKARVVPYGMTLQAEPMANAPDPGRILFCGRDSVRKGLHTLAAAASEARKKCPHIRVRVAGRVHPPLTGITGWAELEFLGELTRKQMAEEYRRADLFVFPTLAEGLAGVLVEALAAGVPVITTRCAGADIRDGENGILVEPGNVASLATTIAKVVEDRTLRDKLSQGARELAAQYTVEAWRQRLLACLQGAAAEWHPSHLKCSIPK